MLRTLCHKIHLKAILFQGFTYRKRKWHIERPHPIVHIETCVVKRGVNPLSAEVRGIPSNKQVQVSVILFGAVLSGKIRDHLWPLRLKPPLDLRVNVKVMARASPVSVCF
jgi:hypothetical protein